MGSVYEVHTITGPTIGSMRRRALRSPQTHHRLNVLSRYLLNLYSLFVGGGGVGDEVGMVGSTYTRGGVGMPDVGTNMHPLSWADPLKIGGDIRGGSS